MSALAASAVGVTDADDAEAEPVPAEFTAATVKVYAQSLCN
jgi:hypothetical protein